MRQSSFKALENRAEEFGAYGFDGLHAFSNDFFDHDTIAQVTGGHANNFGVIGKNVVVLGLPFLCTGTSPRAFSDALSTCLYGS